MRPALRAPTCSQQRRRTRRRWHLPANVTPHLPVNCSPSLTTGSRDLGRRWTWTRSTSICAPPWHAKGVRFHKRDRNTAGMLTMIRNNAFQQDRRHGLVIVDGDYLFRELRTRLTGAAKRDLKPRRFHSALYEILVFLAERGRVVVYAAETAIPERMEALDSARRAGATVTVLTRDGPAPKPANIAMAMAAADALPTIKELILVTGDGALVAVVERARTAGVVTTLACLPGTPSHALSIAADHIVDLPTPPGHGPL